LQAKENKLSIVSSIPDLASIAANIAGDKAEVFSITKGNSNPHAVDVSSYYMGKAASADIYLKAGLDLDAWADDIIAGAGNKKLAVVDCSENIAVLDKPISFDPSQGHLHAQGNPHYWLGPDNAVIIAVNIKTDLVKADPLNKEFYEKNFAEFSQKLNAKYNEWKEKMLPYKGMSFISYHSSWVYFAKAFDFNVAAEIEILPGIPYTAAHLAKLIQIIKEGKIKFILQESYFTKKAAVFLNKETGVRVITRAPSCSGLEPDDYFKYFDSLVNEITEVRP
jgi:zinc/manganese transport system substrate-binding protein